MRSSRSKIVVTLGGSDTYGVTIAVVRLLKAAGRCATIIVGPGFEHNTELQLELDNNFILKRNVPSLIEEFSHHSLAITGGGITPFEANASGLPCIIIANENFEIPIGIGMAGLGGSIYAGHYSCIDQFVFSKDLPLERMSEIALEHFDLNGADRIIRQIEGLS